MTWEVIDLRERVSPDGQTTRWDYTLVLKETKGRTIYFERERGGVYGSGVDTPVGVDRLFEQRLDPHSELRINRFASMGAGLASMTVFWRFEASDDEGQRLRIDIRLPFSRGAGRRVANGPNDRSMRRPVSFVAVLVGLSAAVGQGQGTVGGNRAIEPGQHVFHITQVEPNALTPGQQHGEQAVEPTNLPGSPVREADTAPTQAVTQTQAGTAGTFHMPPGEEPASAATPHQIPLLVPGGNAELERIKNLPSPPVQGPSGDSRSGSEANEIKADERALGRQ